MTFICHQEQTFKGKINNVEITDQKQYWAVITVLQQIEIIYETENHFKDEIHFPDDFIEELADSLEQCQLKYTEDSYSQIADHITYNIWFEKDTLVDLEFSYYDDKRFFETVNDGLKNETYDFKTPVRQKNE